jgi:hypothetical protein
VSAPEQNPTAVPPATETTSGARRRFVGLYGAKPWHLLSLLACFALTGYAVSRLFGDSVALVRITIWFVGAAVVWDLLVGPALALGDSALRPVTRRVRVRGVSPLNHVRFPVLLSLLLLMMWTPLVFQRSEQTYQLKSDLRQDPYLERWAAVTGVLLLLGAVAFAVTVLRAGRGSSGEAPDPR